LICRAKKFVPQCVVFSGNEEGSGKQLECYVTHGSQMRPHTIMKKDERRERDEEKLRDAV